MTVPHDTHFEQPLLIVQELMQNCASSQFKEAHIFISETSLFNRVIQGQWPNLYCTTNSHVLRASVYPQIVLDQPNDHPQIVGGASGKQAFAHLWTNESYQRRDLSKCVVYLGTIDRKCWICSSSLVKHDNFSRNSSTWIKKKKKKRGKKEEIPRFRAIDNIGTITAIYS